VADRPEEEHSGRLASFRPSRLLLSLLAQCLISLAFPPNV
jgi:hypothetical protein